MAPSPNTGSRAGGAFIAAGLLGGAIVGIIYRQPSIGVLAGAAIGAVIAIAIWLIDRRPR